MKVRESMLIGIEVTLSELSPGDTFLMDGNPCMIMAPAGLLLTVPDEKVIVVSLREGNTGFFDLTLAVTKIALTAVSE